MERRSQGPDGAIHSHGMSINVKCLSLERDGAYYGVVVSFDGEPLHHTTRKATRTEAREAAEHYAEEFLGKTPFTRIRLGSNIDDLNAYLSGALLNGPPTR